jgi:molecular chaperone DnaJ
MSKDYYKTLGIEKSASQDDVKRAFRKLAHKYHPDKPNGDEEKFKEINEAYQALGKPENRKKYDQFGAGAFDGSAGGGQGYGGQGFGGFDFSGAQDFGDLGDIFGDLFGGGRGRSRRGGVQGNNIQVDAQLSFYDSIFGVDKEIELTKPSPCERCSGNGAEPAEGLKKCDNCNGDGIVVGVQRTILGNMQTKRTCEVCVGSGEVPKKDCTSCNGQGIEKKKKTLKISIPAGVDDGVVLRVRGEGEAVKGGAAGDLFVQIHVKRDKRFEREGINIYSEAQIGFTQAALGDVIEAETVDGLVDLKIPAGTQSGAQFRLKGKGVPTGPHRGDHLVTVNVKTPKKLSKKQKKLLEELGLNE